MSLTVGELVGYLKLDKRDFDRGLDSSESRFKGFGRQVDDGTRRMGSSFGGLGTAVKALGAMFVAKIGTDMVGSLFEGAAQLELMDNKARTVFAGQLPMVEKWAKANANAMGLTSSQATGLAGNFADLLVPMGFARSEAADMATDVVGLSGALAQWSGGTRSAAEVSEVLAAAMLGERDALKSLGISISEADVQARLAKNGQDELTGAALEQAKAIATQQLIMEKSTDAQAAYAEGQDTLRGKLDNLRATFSELKERGLKALLPHLKNFADWATDNAPMIKEKITDAVKAIGRWIRDDAIPALQSIVKWWQRNGPTIIEWTQKVFGWIGREITNTAAFVGEAVTMFQNFRDDVHLIFLKLEGFVAVWAEKTLRLADKARSWMPGYKGELGRTADKVAAEVDRINADIGRITAEKAIRIAVKTGPAHDALQELETRLGNLRATQTTVGWGGGRKFTDDEKDGGGGIGAASGLVGIGQALQTRGWSVGEHPAFGGVDPVHSDDSYHYAGRAVDINWPGPNERSKLGMLANELRAQYGSSIKELYWPDYDPYGGHDTHLHLAMEKGGVVNRPTLALIGESAKARRGGGEVVAPAGLIGDTVRTVLREEGHLGGPLIGTVQVGDWNVHTKAHLKHVIKDVLRERARSRPRR